MSDIHRILDEIRDIEETKTALVDELDRCIHARYEEVTPSEGEIWRVTLTHPDARPNARDLPAIRTVGGWLIDPNWGSDEDYSHSWWRYHDDDVYPHRKTHLAPREEPNE